MLRPPQRVSTVIIGDGQALVPWGRAGQAAGPGSLWPGSIYFASLTLFSRSDESLLLSNLFWLSEAQLARLQPFFPKSHGRPRIVPELLPDPFDRFSAELSCCLGELAPVSSGHPGLNMKA